MQDSMHSPRQGKVFIVGAGIGGVDYLTVRAAHLLSQAEVIIYDDLIDRDLLDLVPKAATKIMAGKRGGQKSIQQSEINQMLVQYCLAEKQVIRLKSGDPWIFGRSLPEIMALQSAGCAWEVVLGISSAIAAPMLAGIPITEVSTSPCFAVMTGHDLDQLPWQAIAPMPTLIILMGTHNLAALMGRLEESKPPETPVAIVRWCGRTNQEIWTGTIANILKQVPDVSLSPSVIIIGEVVKFRDHLGENARIDHSPNHTIHQRKSEYESKYANNLDRQLIQQGRLKLQGKRILVTRASGQASQFTELLSQQGAEVIEMPTLAILPPTSWAMLDQAIAILHTYDWLILTSANAVEHFFQRLHNTSQDSRALFRLKVAVVGRKTAEVLRNYGIIPDLVPMDFVADALGDAFLNEDQVNKSLSGKKMLFPRVQSGGREVLVEQLQKHGAIVDEVPAYESGCPDAIDPMALRAIQERKLDAIAFASSKTVKHFCKLLDGVTTRADWYPWLDGVVIASIGPQTSKTCHELLGRVDCEAAEYTLDGLAQAITNVFA
ncbi:MAG: uroporphyrinogen-III C-methyltransferase [Pseudanabaenaceae cyanobacterium bins.39]|nr:uroporphyrinogen-III C-methyltransferase [Pseudanabaenaceae cyanobacterium bins.39]